MTSPQPPESTVPSPHPAVEPNADLAPHPGVESMPRWDLGDLPAPPVFKLRNIAGFIGPGIVLGASAIGGGEWLTGPLNTARFGGALLWLSTISILCQTLYNIEISRYTLYTGEPIFTGKFRLFPGPMFWLSFYLILDFGSFLPYLASSAAIPVLGLYLGYVPNPKEYDLTLRLIGCVILVGVMVPLSVGGKVYNSLKAIMVFKLCFVVGFLLILAFMFSTFETWREIGTGFFQFGNVPVVAENDLNGNGIQDADEQPLGENVKNVFTEFFGGRGFPLIDLSVIGILATMAAISGNGGLTNTPMSNYTRDQGWGMGRHVGAIPSFVGGHEIALSHVGMVFRQTKENLTHWAGWLKHVRREQLMIWMPACFIGLALPSMLSVQFLPRRTVLENNWAAAGMTANGVAEAVSGVPSERLFPKSAKIVRGGDRVELTPEQAAEAEKNLPPITTSQRTWGQIFWTMTLLCGFLVLGTSCASTAEGTLRRWVDVTWTASAHMRKIDPKHIGKLYFAVLWAYVAIGIFMLMTVNGADLLVLSGMLYNYALGFSCFHTLFVNSVLLPKPIRPGWGARCGLLAGGLFFSFIAVLATYAEWHNITKVFGKFLSLVGISG
ncbi:MAG: hypothetical protein C0478_00785 [Planctomyces sp.]|nr:hypothetical protein [Planctomyces sp.]